MKKFITFIIVLLMVLSFSKAVYADSETDVFNTVKAMGFNDAYVAIENGSLLIRFETPAISDNFSDVLLSIAVKGYEKYPQAEAVIVESYMDNSPALGVALRGEDIANWEKGALSDSDLYDRADFMDLRSETDEVRDDLAGFNAYVDQIAVNDNGVQIVLHYFGKETDFLDDFAAMSFFIAQDLPYVDNISITYVPHEEGRYLTVQATKNNVLALYDGTLSQDDFVKSLAFKQSANPPSVSSNNGVMSFLNGLLGKTPLKNGARLPDPLIQLVAAGVLFLLFFVFLIMARNRRKRVAYITKAKTISLKNFPRKRRAYGKLVGVVQAITPLEAPFSKKSVVMYDAELMELRSDTTQGEETNKWVTVWKDKKATDFRINELHGSEGILVKGNGAVPKIDLPVTFNKTIRDKNDPIIQPFLQRGVFKFLSHRHFKAKEKALENGRKVFFIGGIQRIENGFEFIERPHFVNMISVHSEKRLTGHYRKLSFYLTFFSIISLLASLYFLLSYLGII